MNVTPFHLILYWPLHVNIPKKGDKAANDKIVEKEPAFWDYVDQQMGKVTATWQQRDPLFRDKDQHQQIHYEEAVYFHPFVQQALYGKNDPLAPPDRKKNDKQGARPAAVRLYANQRVTGMAVTRWDKSVVNLKVERLHLYFFETELAMLVTEVSQAEPLALETAMDLQNTLRRVYPPGWAGLRQDAIQATDRNTPLHCPTEAKWLPDDRDVREANYDSIGYFVGGMAHHRQPAGSHHWVDVLPQMHPDIPGSRGYHLLGDDRMPSMAYFAVPEPRKVSRADQIRIAFADGPGSWAMPYAPEFLADFERDCCYDRFWTVPATDDPAPSRWDPFTTRYFCTGWSFAALGRDSKNEFFREHALAHFRHHYFQMGLLVYLQYSSLLVFSNRLSRAVEHAEHDEVRYRTEINQIAKDLARFTDRFWTTEVSNQMQARELFALWTRQLQVAALYQHVKEEAHFVLETLEGRAQEQLNRQAFALTAVSGFTGIVSAAVGALGMNMLNGDKPKWSMLTAVCVVGTLTALAMAGFSYWLFRLRRRQQR